MRRLFALMLLVLSLTPMTLGQPAIGSWNDHLSYRSVRHVALAPGKVYAAAPQGLFCYSMEDEAIYRMNKVTMLNDVGVSTMGYDPTTGYLVVAYNNANIDLVKDDKVFNISDIKRSSIPGNRDIHSIRFHKRCAYLSCGFGIVVVDLDRHEIKETYYIGEDGTYLEVNDLVFTADHIVAATPNGMRFATKDDPLLNIFTHWETDTTSLLANEPVTALDVYNNKILALSEGALFTQDESQNMVPWLYGDIRSFHVSNDRILVCDYQSVSLYDHSLALRQKVTNFDEYDMQSLDAQLANDGELWVGHDWFGLVRMPEPYTSGEIMVPNGPNDDHVYRMVTFDDKVYLCPGGHRTTYEGMYYPPYLSCYQKGEWSVFPNENGMLGRCRDIVDLAVNPLKPSQLMAASWGVGVAEFEGNKMKGLYNDTNTDGAITRFRQGDFTGVFTGGVAFDTKGNCWVTNALQDKGLAVRHEDGKWEAFDIALMLPLKDRELDRVLWDSVNNQLWLYGRPNQLYVVAPDGRMAHVDPNNGSKMETSTVNCLVQDHEGDLWMGTNKGIKRIFDAYKAFRDGGEGEKSPVTCTNIIIEEDGFSEYLMAYESITCMAVDGANRKWVGTSGGGLYLLSATGAEQLEHFTASNSPLFSDKIITLAIQPWTGEVFIGTDQGLQSYRSTATYADNLPQNEIHAFPNPVRPEYDGPIAIKGFTRNALIHITDAAGHAVYSGRANGGQAVWNGRTLSGEKVASGVYFVFSSDENGKNRLVTKVLVVR